MPAKGCSDATPFSRPPPRGPRRARGRLRRLQRLHRKQPEPGPCDVKLALDWYPNPDHVGIFAGMERGDFAVPRHAGDAGGAVGRVRPDQAGRRQAGRPGRVVRAGGVLRRRKAHPGGRGGGAGTDRAQLDHRPHRPRHPPGHRPARKDDRRGRKRIHHRLRQDDAADGGRPDRLGAPGDGRIQPGAGPALGQGRRDRRRLPKHRRYRHPRPRGCDHRLSRRPLWRAQLRRAGDHRQSRPDAVRPKLSRRGAGVRDRLDQGHQLGSESSSRCGRDHAQTEFS